MASGRDLNASQVRREIVRYGSLLWERGLVRGTSGNISFKLKDGSLLVTPASESLRALEANELVHVSPRGEVLGGKAPTSELPLHLAAYRARSDIQTVIHTHPTFCVTWSKTGRLFARDTVGAQETLGAVAWTPFAPAGSQELAEITAHAFAAGNDTVVMERHGVSAVGDSLERAFVLTDLVEEAARLAYFSRLLYGC